MKALILRGKYKGKEVEVSQWCNDWFTLDPRKSDGFLKAEMVDIMRKPFSPTSLAFTIKDMQTIKKHKNNGMLFMWFAPIAVTSLPHPYLYTFKRIYL